MRWHFAGVIPSSPIGTVEGSAEAAGFGVRRLFLTYLDAWEGDPMFLATMRARYPEADIIVDSGAHSFFGMHEMGSATGKVNKLKAPNAEEYMRSYAAWLERWKGHYDFFVELDISEIVGMGFVDRWRRSLIERGLWSRCITAWHTDMDWSHWEEQLALAVRDDGSRYVAIQGMRKNTDILPYNRFIRPAYDCGVRVHGFAFTSEWTERFAFASVDSLTWRCSEQYGTVLTCDGLRLRQVHPAYAKDSFDKLPAREAAKANPARSREMEIRNCVANARTIVELERRLTALWKERGVDWEAVERASPSPRRVLHGQGAIA